MKMVSSGPILKPASKGSKQSEGWGMALRSVDSYGYYDYIMTTMTMLS